MFLVQRNCLFHNIRRPKQLLFSSLNHHPNFLIHLRLSIRREYVSSKSVLEKELNETFDIERIRNFSIIAHIDHGKSTLADRLLEFTGTISKDDRNKQVLDKLKVERERGITVKAQSASMIYNHKGQKYLLNLIDTPGHVDFSYEVSRSLAACQGCLLLVDACQGIQAQTVANFYLAFGEDLKIIPVINKIDLPNANPKKVMNQLKSTFEIETSPVLVSAKSGLNIENVIDSIIQDIPPPTALSTEPSKFRSLLFDSWYDKYVGVVCLIAVKDGVIRKGDKIISAHTQNCYEVTEVGVMYPNPVPTGKLTAGQVGYIIPGMKTVKEAIIGDTFHLSTIPTSSVEIIPGFAPIKPMVFCGIYPVNSEDYSQLAQSLERLTLNDSSVTIFKESSSALGNGFRLGFLGTLHMDVFKQRLEEEHEAQVINTMPTVPYKMICFSKDKHGNRIEELIEINSPNDFPDIEQARKVETFLEPMVNGTILFPKEYVGNIMNLCGAHRGEQLEYTFIDDERVMMKYKFPLSEILTDFYDQLKSKTSGYASFDYEECGYEESNLVKVSFLLNGKSVDALDIVAHNSKAEQIGKEGVKKLKDIIDRGLVEIAIQAAVNKKVIARETIKALRRDVTAKCYGGDITRKMKLLEKQKEGKKRMKKISGVNLPQEAFMLFMKNGKQSS